MTINSEDFRIYPGKGIKLDDTPTAIKPFGKSKKQYHKTLRAHVEQLSSPQHLHYASNRYALLLVFQGMDAAGKDGAIRHVMSGVNPQGCEVLVSSNRAPTSSNTISSGGRRAAGPSADASGYSIVLTMTRSSLSACIRSPSGRMDFQRNCMIRRGSGRTGTVRLWLWSPICTSTARMW